MTTIDVVTSKGYWQRIALLCGLLGPFAASLFVEGARGLRGAYAGTGRSAFAFGLGLVLLAIPILLVVLRRRWVARFDDEGVVLRNGRRFAWRDFQRVVPRRRRRDVVTSYDLVFRDGRAGLYHLMARNRAEVERLVGELAAGRNPFLPAA